MRIGIDIDSTLHHYWDVLSAAARRRFGVDLPYESQYTWGITRRRPEQLALAIAETHREDVIMAGVPYPDAVETVREWHEAGHWIHITSHRTTDAHEPTARWLEAIGLPFDDLHCSDDKVSRCRALGIDLLIDDGPLNLRAAADAGITVATIEHPWNADVRQEEPVISAPDWRGLRAALAPVLAGARP